jgi:oligoendopeptidase F
VDARARLKPELGQVIATMHEMQHLDLDSRRGKAPGGYNYPLNETGVPFIFMNAAGLHDDLVTMVHEAGHAVHSFVTRDLAYNFYKDFPSEVAELASMGMEMLSMDHWDVFYQNEEDLRRARKQQLLRSVTLLPWIATVDAFQFWLYDNPGHAPAQREDAFVQLYRRFHGNVVDYSGIEDYLRNHWQKQLHIFELPFYYIEYGIAQLGALQVWKNYREDRQKGLEMYLQGLRMGFTRPLGELYAAAGIRFDFSATMIQELVDMVLAEYKRLD